VVKKSPKRRRSRWVQKTASQKKMY
jgi:hypothetical protein